jgi:tetratricopeptide (TPR) repeat protein
VSDVASLRGEGRWPEALALVDDPLARADLLNEQALFTGSADARAAAGRELDRAETLVLLGRGRLLHARFLADRREDPEELRLFERAVALARDTGDRRLLGESLFWLGLFHQVVRGDDDLALPLLEESYRLAREARDTKLMSCAVRHRGFAYDAAGRREEAWAAFQESVELRRSDGFLPGVAAGLLTLGEVAAERGRDEEARTHYAEARSLAERVGAAPFVRRIADAEEALG